MKKFLILGMALGVAVAPAQSITLTSYDYSAPYDPVTQGQFVTVYGTVDNTNGVAPITDCGPNPSNFSSDDIKPYYWGTKSDVVQSWNTTPLAVGQSYTGALFTIGLKGLRGGSFDFDTLALYKVNGIYEDVTPGQLSHFQTVPEPCTFAALGFGLLPLIRRRRRA